MLWWTDLNPLSSDCAWSPPVIKAVDLHCKDNNTEHHTAEISEDRLIVRRGQAFRLTLTLTQPFIPNLHPLSVVAITGGSASFCDHIRLWQKTSFFTVYCSRVSSPPTGDHPAEELGTKSVFGIPDTEERSPSAKAVWTMELDMSSSTFHPVGVLDLTVVPPADAPIGQYSLTVIFKDEEEELASLVVLFNPWCAGLSVHVSLSFLVYVLKTLLISVLPVFCLCLCMCLFV